MCVVERNRLVEKSKDLIDEADMLVSVFLLAVVATTGEQYSCESQCIRPLIATIHLLLYTEYYTLISNW